MAMGHATAGNESLAPVPANRATFGELEALLQRVEQHLDDLQSALGTRDMRCIELHAGELHGALAAAVAAFARIARQGGAPLALRRRLALASAQVTAQRDALARATAALDRAIDVLMPDPGAAVYGAGGTSALRRPVSASIEA